MPKETPKKKTKPKEVVKVKMKSSYPTPPAAAALNKIVSTMVSFNYLSRQKLIAFSELNPSTITRGIRKLKQDGVISVTKQIGDSGQKETFVTILDKEKIYE